MAPATRDETPLDATAAETPVRAAQFQQRHRRKTDQGIRRADEQERLEAGVGGFRPHRHVAPAFVQQDAIDAPGDDREQAVVIQFIMRDCNDEPHGQQFDCQPTLFQD